MNKALITLTNLKSSRVIYVLDAARISMVQSSASGLASDGTMVDYYELNGDIRILNVRETPTEVARMMNTAISQASHR